MLDELKLGKDKFVGALKTQGKTDIEIEAEWQKFIGNFAISMVEEAFKLFSKEEKNQLLAGLSVEVNPEDGLELFKRTDKFLSDHPEKVVDKKDFFEKIVKTTQTNYSVG